MKTIKNILYSAVIMLLFINASCTKPEPPIPTGNHTFSCRINGNLFLPNKGGGCGFSTLPCNGDGLDVIGSNNNLTLSITAFNSTANIVYFNIVNYKLGVFTLMDSNGLTRSEGDPRDINHAIAIKNGIKYLSKQGSGTVTFTDLDKNAKGTFEFKLYNEKDSNDVITVTEGRFDN